ncbi:MAG: HAD family phosphatase [Ruminococcus sp.]|nr:HAD family phosphatase [Ruminococcus sp.]
MKLHTPAKQTDLKAKIASFKGYIFDLDGTLLDSFGVWNTVDTLFLNKRGFEVPSDYGREISAMGFDAAAEYTIRRFGFKEEKEDIIKEWNSIAISLFESEVKLFDGARDFLLRLKKLDKKLAVATASHTELLAPCLINNGVYELFDKIVTVNEVGCGKDSPEIYLSCAERMELAPCDCVVFEDVPKAVESAKSAGFKTVGFLSYGNESDHAELKRLSDYIIEGYDEL